jgi:hypothetical protein
VPEEVRINKKTGLVQAIAWGKTIIACARQNKVPLRTAYR